MTHTNKLTVVTAAIVTKFQTDTSTASPTLKASTPNADGSFPQVLSGDVFYGDQERIARSPTICVEPSNKNVGLTGMTQMAENDFTVFVFVYVGGPEVQLARAQCDQIGEAAETLLNLDLQLKNGNPGVDGLVIHGYCTNFESGYSFKPGLMRSVRITWQGKTKLKLN